MRRTLSLIAATAFAASLGAAAHAAPQLGT